MDELLMDEENVLDPTYQTTLYMIEQGLRETGVLPPAPNNSTAYPSMYDDALLSLIDSVPLE